MLLPTGTTVAVVDGEKLSLFRSTGHESSPKLTPLAAPPITQDNHGSGARHHISSANHDHGQVEEDSHSAGVAAVLNQQATAGHIDGLVVIASPRALGELRKHYGKQLSAVLLKEIDKDLAGRPVTEVEQAIAAA